MKAKSAAANFKFADDYFYNYFTTYLVIWYIKQRQEYEGRLYLNVLRFLFDDASLG